MEKRRKIKTLLNHRKTMDRPGPMFHYLLPQSSLFRVQSWNIMQWNNKKMGKNVSSANKMTRAILLSLLCNCVLMLSSLTVFPAPLPAFPCPPPLLFFAASIYFSLINTTRHILRTSNPWPSSALDCLQS